MIIYPSRRIEREETLQFGEILVLERVKRIYLDELEEAEFSLGVEAVKLVIEKDKHLIKQAKQQLADQNTQRNFIDLIETIIVYKLPQKSRKEIAAMFGLGDLKQTKVYQEALEEGKQEGKQEGIQEAKLESIPRMLHLGLSLEVISQSLDLPLEVIEQVAQSQQYNE